MSRITTLVPWYGSNRSLARHVGAQLAGRAWVGVPFAGGMSEIRHITARTLVVSDLHRHVINLAQVAADADLNVALRKRLADLPFHPDVLAAAQLTCSQREAGTYTGCDCPLWWACDYFVCAWMGRNGTAGTAGEFAGGLSVRWDAGGGDSATRFRAATEALSAWQETMRRCNFLVRDVFDFLADVHDSEECGVYCDPPFPGPGDRYRHTFTEQHQRDLAAKLAAFSKARVVCRFYDHPLIRELYPEPKWRWLPLAGGRTQHNGAPPEVLVLNGEPLTEGATE